MKYHELYDNMVEILGREVGIRARLCKFLNIKNEGKIVREIIYENTTFNNSTDSINKFICDFYSLGGITKKSYTEFQSLING